MAAKSRSASFLVASGILLSRIAGLVRQRVFAHYFGQSAAADAFSAAFRIPNFLQNLFGEGVLSASFIPVYSRLLAKGDEKEAGRVAGAIASIILLVVSLIVLVGVLLTPWLVALIAPGFDEERRALTIQLTRFFFPGAGLLVLSAWCLGILNSHRKFFLSYTAPVLWNVVMIAAMFWFGGISSQSSLAVTLALASVVGSAAQFLIQLPVVLRLVAHLDLTATWSNGPVRTVLKNFVPVFFGRGVVQVSAFVDSMLASLLPLGAVSAINYAQVLYTLPVSLFGMSVSAAELPEMSSELGTTEEVASKLRTRLERGMRQITVMIIPSVIGFLALGNVIASSVYQTGKFTASDANYVWLILAGSSVGMLASTLGRLYASAFYALGDTRRPFQYSCLRVLVSTVLGFLSVKWGPLLLGVDPKLGVLGITLAGGLGAWVEFSQLKRGLRKRIGETGLPIAFYGKLFLAALIASAAAMLLENTPITNWHPVLRAMLVLGIYGSVYFGTAIVLKIDEATAIFRRFKR